VHKHLHTHPNVLGGLAAAAKEAGLPVRSISPEMREVLGAAGVRTNDGFLGEAGRSAFWTLEELERQLARVGEGVTELMCHPGHAPTEVQSGYSAQREIELATFVDPRARELLAGAGVELGDFTALRA
jgi:chitin disaccharide deacetylase